MGDGWNIDPDGVAVVLSQVGRHVTGDNGLIEEAKKFGTHTLGAAKASQSQLISKALSEYFEGYSKTLTGMGNKTGRCISGAVTATKAYLAADLEMAAAAQRNAIKAPAPQIKPRVRP